MIKLLSSLCSCIIIIFVIYFVYYKKELFTTQLDKSNFNTKLSLHDNIELMQCMLVIDKIFEKNNIWYIIAFGTLLGAVRHRDIIPWDDDIDLFVYFSQINEIENALKELEKNGYTIRKTYKLYQVVTKSGNTIDLFLINDENDKIVRCLTTDNNICKKLDKNALWWWKEYSFNSNLIRNRKRFQFGNLYLWGPTNAMELLKYWYGNDFLTICESQKLERTNKGHEKHVIPEEKICNYGIPQI